MPKVEKLLYCSDCHLRFTPATQHLLRSNEERFRQQLFMDGACPHCNAATAGYIGINVKDETFVRISIKKAPKWYDRLDTDLIQERPIRIDTSKHSKKRMKTVLGFKKETNSGKWMPQIQAVR